MKISRKSNGGAARRARLAAYMATGVGAIGLGTSSQAAVVSIDLTGNTGDNMGLPNGFQRNYYFIPNSTLIASNNYNGFFGLGITGITGAGVAVTSTGSGDAETPIKFGPGEWIDSSFDDFTPSYNKSVFKNPTRTVGDFGPNSFIGTQSTESTPTAASKSFGRRRPTRSNWSVLLTRILVLRSKHLPTHQYLSQRAVLS